MIAFDFIIGLLNFLHAGIDAERIAKNKRIYHGINGLIYLGICFVFALVVSSSFFWLIASISFLRWLALRQLTFDIPLNILRGLEWDYISPEPKAWLDKLELKVFKGVYGRAEKFYLRSYIILLIIELLLITLL